jgi:hypothetical protein
MRPGAVRAQFPRNFIFALVFTPRLTIFLAMKGTVKILGVALSILVVAGRAEAQADNPYQTIPLRNVFGIGSAPPPPAPPAPPEIPVNVKFTGITTYENPPHAWFLVPGDPGKPEVSVKLAVGQRQGSLELLEIFEETGEVRILNSGKEARLNFREHGNKAFAAAPAPPTPGVPRPGQAVPGVPGSAARTLPKPAAPSGIPTSYGTPVAQPAVNTAGGRSIPLNIPSRNVRLPSNQQPQPPQPTLTYEESVINVAIQTELHRDIINEGGMPPFPPTPLTPDAPGAPPIPGGGFPPSPQ